MAYYAKYTYADRRWKQRNAFLDDRAGALPLTLSPQWAGRKQAREDHMFPRVFNSFFPGGI